MVTLVRKFLSVMLVLRYRCEALLLVLCASAPHDLHTMRLQVRPCSRQSAQSRYLYSVPEHSEQVSGLINSMFFL